MSTAALEALIRHQRALIAALDSDDAAGIATTSGEMEQAIVRIRAGTPPKSTQARLLAEEAMLLADAARVRVNVLADMTGRRLTRLAAATGVGTAAPVYGRNAKMKR